MFESFVQKALAQDKRNCFSPYDGPVDFIPDAFQAFYRDTDPIGCGDPFWRLWLRPVFPRRRASAAAGSV